MWRLGPDGYGSISSWYQCVLGRRRARLRIRDVEGPRVLPDALPFRLDLVRLVSRCHRKRLLERKSLSEERPWGAGAASPRVSPWLDKKQLLHWLLDTSNVLELFPDTARVDDGELSLGGVPATRLAREHGTPLLVYCEADDPRAGRARTARPRPGALVVYGTKAFANVALLRLLAEEGVGADVSTLGELAFARAAGIPGERLVFHGNNKSDEELRAAAEAGALVVLDAPGEAERARAAGVRRVLVRLTPGVEAVTHRSIQTAHAESKFGMAPETARARSSGRASSGSTSRACTSTSARSSPGSTRACSRSSGSSRSATRAASAGRRACSTSAAGSASATTATSSCRRWRSSSARSSRAIPHGACSSILEPGRSLVGRAGVTLYRVGAVKESGGVTLRGDRRRHVRQPAAAALRRALRGAAREPRGRAAGRRLPASPASTASPATS